MVAFSAESEGLEAIAGFVPTRQGQEGTAVVLLVGGGGSGQRLCGVNPSGSPGHRVAVAGYWPTACVITVAMTGAWPPCLAEGG
jgi:hypothetical protein